MFAGPHRCRMVGPVSRGRIERIAFILALTLGAQAAAAAEPDVTVKCVELSSEDAAQVEARVRASLLGASLVPMSVDLRCEERWAQAQVTGNGHQVMLRTDRGASSVKDALLSSADSALSEWSALSTEPPAASPLPSPATAPAVEPPANPPARPPVAPASMPIATERIPDARPVGRPLPASTWLAAGLRAESWSSGSALGGQLGLQQKLDSAFLAVHAGYLVSVPRSAQFSAHELQVGAQIGWQPQPLGGLRAALGVGLSQFGADPASGISVQNGSTSSILPCLSAQLSRPVEFGAFALLPAVGLRAFTRSRSVLIDGQRVLALPALALEASLSFAVRVGG